MGENDNFNSSWLSIIFTSISIPIIAYSIAFITELGYFEFYKLPTELIEISFSSLFNSVILTILLFFYVFYAGSFYLKNYPELFTNNLVRIFYAYILPIISIISYCLSLLFYRDKKYQLLLLIFAFQIIFFPGYIKYVRKVNKTRPYQKHKIILFVIFLSTLFPGLFFVSKGLAEKQIKYYILRTSPERIIVRMYKDIMIVAPFDRDKKIIDPTYTILKTSEITSPIRLERIGKMKISNGEQIPKAKTIKKDKQ